MPGTSGLSAHPAGDRLSEIQHEVLEATASGQGLVPAMDLLCRRVEALAPGVVCSILSVDQQGLLHPLAAPSLPADYSAALDSAPIGPCVGSCGTAAYRGEPVAVIDIATDPLWADYKSLPLPLGLRACWSSPIKARDNRVIGTFAFYYPETRDRARARGSKNEDPSAGVLRFRHWPAQPRYVPAARGRDCHGAPSR
jgi:GAF domain-containing protein